MSRKTIKVLFVCLGNICRSPTAEGVFRNLVEKEGESDWIKTDSAGTHAYHIGSAPDTRAQQAALKRGIDLSKLKGRQAQVEDFDQFDYVLAMDEENYSNLNSIAPSNSLHKLDMFLSYSTCFEESDVPDPYYGGDQGFNHVLDLIEDACIGLLQHIRNRP